MSSAHLTFDRFSRRSPAALPFVALFAASQILALRPVVVRAAEPLPSVWPSCTSNETCYLEGHTDGISGVAFCPGGLKVVSCSRDGTVRVWDATSGKEKKRLDGHGRWISCVAVSPDGKLVASGCDGSCHDVFVWDLETGKELFRLAGHDIGIASVAFSGDSRFLASGGDDGIIRIWDATKGKEVSKIEAHAIDKGIRCIAFSPDGHRIASSSADVVKLWDAESGKMLQEFEGQKGRINSIAFSTDGHTLLGGSGTMYGRGKKAQNALHLWDAETGKEIRCFEGNSAEVNSVALSSDGRYALSGSGDSLGGRPVDCTVRLWDVKTGKELYRMVGHRSDVRSVAFSSDGRYALSGSDDRTARMWRLPGPLDKIVPADEKAWELVSFGKACIAVPGGWKEVAYPSYAMLTYREGDGIILPQRDETGSALQAGITVEKYTGTKQSLKEGMEGLVEKAKHQAKLHLVGEEKVESIKLADGSEALLLTAEFVKEGRRRSLQMKMMVKGAEDTGWVVSGCLVGDKLSKIPCAESPEAQWLRAHITSFCFDKTKLDESGLKKSYKALADKSGNIDKDR